MAVTVPKGAEARRRLLVITYHFTPDRSVGGLRWAGLTKYLARMGWEVHVLTAAAQPTHEPERGLYVHVCKRGRTANDVYNAFAQWVRRSRSVERTEAVGGGTDAPEPGFFGRLRKEVGAALGFPDYARGWILRCAWDARRLLAASRFDAVVTSGPPHSAHLAGVLATLGRPGLLRIDMRDPWSDLRAKEWSQALYKT